MPLGKRSREENNDENREDRLQRICLQQTMCQAETFNRICEGSANPFLSEVEEQLPTDGNSDPSKKPEWMNELLVRIEQLQKKIAADASAATTNAAAQTTEIKGPVTPATVKTEPPVTLAEVQTQSPVAQNPAAETKSDKTPPPTNAPAKLHNRKAWTEEATRVHISHDVIDGMLEALVKENVPKPYAPNSKKVDAFLTKNDLTKEDKQKQIELLVNAYRASKLTRCKQPKKAATSSPQEEVFIKQEAVAESVENPLQLSGDP
jgi:hypothetical protein